MPIVRKKSGVTGIALAWGCVPSVGGGEPWMANGLLSTPISENGTDVVMAAASTPGRTRTFAMISSYSPARRAQGYRVDGGAICMLTVLAGSNPGSVSSSRVRLRSITPDPSSSTSVIATCAMTAV